MHPTPRRRLILPAAAAAMALTLASISTAWAVPTCPADFNQDNQVSVQDIFDFLAVWFGGNPAVAKFNGDCCITVQDLFDFLAAYFAGC